MRLLILIILGVGFITGNARSQSMGEIEVNENFTATLNFADDIEFIVLGNNPQISEDAGQPKFQYYDIYQSGKTCVIRGNDPASPTTSITIKLLDGKVWFGTVKYGKNTKIFYDFEETEKSKKEEEKTVEIKKEYQKEAKIKERLSMVMNEKTEYSTLGIVENKMVFQVTNIKNDAQYTYLEINVKNNSGNDYEIDAVYFKYQEGKRRGIKKKEAKLEERIVTEYETPLKVISAYKEENLGFVIPLFAVGEKGNLIIQFKEKNGTRNAKIDIKGKDMLRVKVFEHFAN